MDIEVYENIYSGLEKYIADYGKDFYSPSLVHFPSSKPTYPYVVFEEVRNNVGNHSFGDIKDVVSNLGYRVRVYAKTKGSVSKLTIARKIAMYLDRYFENIGLKQVSFNPDPTVADGDLCGIIVMYNSNLYNNRRMLI